MRQVFELVGFHDVQGRRRRGRNEAGCEFGLLFPVRGCTALEKLHEPDGRFEFQVCGCGEQKHREPSSSMLHMKEVGA